MASLARRARARLLRRPGRLLLRLGIALAVVQALTTVPEPRVAMPPIDLVNGSVDITATPLSGAVTLAGMVPGDSFTGSVVVGNGGSGLFTYGLSTSTTDAVLGAQLDLEVWDEAGEADGDGSCAAIAPAEVLYGPAAVGGAAPIAVLADRELAAGAAERLCLRISLPLTTGNEHQGASTVATFDFVSEGDEPVAGGSGAGGGAATTTPTDPAAPTETTAPPPTSTPTTEAPPEESTDAPPAADGGPTDASADTGAGDAGDGTGGSSSDGGTTFDASTTTTSTVPGEATTTTAPGVDEADTDAGDAGGGAGGSGTEAAPPAEPAGVWNEILERLAPVLRVVREVASAARFPMALLIAMILFLLLQDSIDRRDPKLALAPVFPEPDIEFPTDQPPDLKVPPSEPRNTT